MTSLPRLLFFQDVLLRTCGGRVELSPTAFVHPVRMFRQVLRRPQLLLSRQKASANSLGVSPTSMQVLALTGLMREGQTRLGVRRH